MERDDDDANGRCGGGMEELLVVEHGQCGVVLAAVLASRKQICRGEMKRKTDSTKQNIVNWNLVKGISI